MAITNSISTLFPEIGVPFYSAGGTSAWQKLGTALSGTVAVTTTFTFPNSVTLTRGRWRIKISGVGGTTPTIILRAYLSDGTNTADVLLPLAAFALSGASATSAVDLNGYFIVDISAVSFNVVTTLGGTAPTATLDFEVFGLQ